MRRTDARHRLRREALVWAVALLAGALVYLIA